MILLRILGKLFIGAGISILLFLGYELWGTGFLTERDQRALAQDFAEIADTPASPTPGASPSEAPSPSGGSGGSSKPRSGPAVIARLVIPKINLDRYVVEGVTTNDLKKGPGHYPGTSYPGEKGNTVFSGHRITYGEPFAHLDELVNGDLIRVSTAAGTFEYEVSEKLIVAPDAMAVVQSFEDERLTLTTCHPRYSSKQRLVIVAKRVPA